MQLCYNKQIEKSQSFQREQLQTINSIHKDYFQQMQLFYHKSTPFLMSEQQPEHKQG